MKHKVVIVDDHVLFTKALEEMVNQFSGYEVLFSAENGKDFIDKLSDSNEDPDVVLLDLNMPIMDGFETLKWIKEQKKNVKTVIIVKIVIVVLSVKKNVKTVIVVKFVIHVKFVMIVKNVRFSNEQFRLV